MRSVVMDMNPLSLSRKHRASAMPRERTSWRYSAGPEPATTEGRCRHTRPMRRLAGLHLLEEIVVAALQPVQAAIHAVLEVVPLVSGLCPGAIQ